MRMPSYGRRAGRRKCSLVCYCVASHDFFWAALALTSAYRQRSSALIRLLEAADASAAKETAAHPQNRLHKQAYFPQ